MPTDTLPADALPAVKVPYVLGAVREGFELPEAVTAGMLALDVRDWRLEGLKYASVVATPVTAEHVQRGLLAVKMFVSGLHYAHLMAGADAAPVRFTPSAELDPVFEACVVLSSRWSSLCTQVTGAPVHHEMGVADTGPFVAANLEAIGALFSPHLVPWEFFQPTDCSKSCKVVNCWAFVESPN